MSIFETHGAELRFWGALILGAISVAALLAWRARATLGSVYGSLLSIDGHLKTLNGQVQRNTEGRHVMERELQDIRAGHLANTDTRLAVLTEQMDTLTGRVVDEVLPALNRLEHERSSGKQ